MFTGEITHRILHRMTEEKNRLVLDTIQQYLINGDWQDSGEIERMVISKALIKRALICFKNEHPEEFEALQQEVQDGETEPSEEV